jgi:hypothetical protein
MPNCRAAPQYSSMHASTPPQSSSRSRRPESSQTLSAAGCGSVCWRVILSRGLAETSDS